MSLPFRKPEPLRIEGDVLENIRTFRRDLGCYFLANKTWDKRRETQIARLLNLMDEDALLVYYTLDVSRSRDATVDDILNAFEAYFLPEKNTTVEIVNFMNRIQHPREPFDEYLTDLKNLIPSCQFGVHENRLLAAQIIRGLFNKEARSKLLENEMTLDQVIEYCRNFEITEEASRLSIEDDEEQQPRKFVLVKTHHKHKKPKKCGRCNENHPYGECKAFNKRCYFCDRMGHLAKCCRNRIDYVDLDEDEEEEEEEEQEYLDCIGILTVDPKDSDLLEEIEAALSGKSGHQETRYVVRQNPCNPPDSGLDTARSSESDMCSVCFSKPQNGLFVHNNIAHVYGCFGCAKKIYRTSGNCPICRRKILKVTKLFVS